MKKKSMAARKPVGKKVAAARRPSAGGPSGVGGAPKPGRT